MDSSKVSQEQLDALWTVSERLSGVQYKTH